MGRASTWDGWVPGLSFSGPMNERLEQEISDFSYLFLPLCELKDPCGAHLAPCCFCPNLPHWRSPGTSLSVAYAAVL